jgi:hypothetical protein
MEYSIGDFIEFNWSRYTGVARILKNTVYDGRKAYECYSYVATLDSLTGKGMIMSTEIIRKLTKDESLLLVLSE